MKTMNLLVCALLCAVFSHAQVTITGANNYQIGDVFTSQTADPAGVTPGSSGANITWDFSGLVASGSPSVGTLETTANLTYASDFLGVINCGTTNADAEGYLLVTNSEYTVVGASLANNSIVDNYTNDPRELVKFPISYGDVFNETFSGTQNNSAASLVWNRGGTITIEADGYGTLILPNGTYNNVLRIKVTTLYSDMNPVLPTINYEDELHLWYSLDSRGFLLSHNLFTTMISGFPSSITTIVYNNPIMVGTQEVLAENIKLNVFPNPSQNQAQLQLQDLEGQDVTVEISDINGRLIERVEVNGADEEVLTFGQKYEAGIYSVHAFSSTMSQVVRFVKQ